MQYTKTVEYFVVDKAHRATIQDVTWTKTMLLPLVSLLHLLIHAVSKTVFDVVYENIMNGWFL